MADPYTLRVLSLDGGGMRGLFSATFMKLFVQQWGINPNEIWKYFDIITGSSIGGIQALAYCLGMAPTDVMSFFITDGPWIFTTSTSTPSVMPSTLTKISVMVGGSSSFYPSTTAGIGTMRLQSKLSSVLGTNTLQNMKTNVLITSFEKNDVDPDFEKDTNTPVYFSNMSLIPAFQGQNFKAVDVAMSTSAAPLYFPAWNIGQDSYIDGGVTQNNPASFALAVAKALKPTANRYCVLSLGTGLGDVGFPPSTASFQRKHRQELAHFRSSPTTFALQYNVSLAEMERLRQLDNLGILEGAYLLMYLIGAMTTGPQEITALELDITSKYTLDNLYYYRLQTYMDDNQDTELDNSSPQIVQYYQDAATAYFNNDIANINTFIGHLTA
jgi:predicted acylesterase/phospholipase RssA